MAKRKGYVSTGREPPSKRSGGGQPDPLPALPPAGLRYAEESAWLDRLFDSFIQGKLSVHDLKRGVVLVFESYAKRVRMEAKKEATALRVRLRRTQPPNIVVVAAGATTTPAAGCERTAQTFYDILVPKAECPKCGKKTLMVKAPYEVWLTCASCGYTDCVEPGADGWAQYVDYVQSYQLTLTGGDVSPPSPGGGR